MSPNYVLPISNKGHHVHSCPFVHLLHLLLGPTLLGLLSAWDHGRQVNHDAWLTDGLLMLQGTPSRPP